MSEAFYMIERVVNGKSEWLAGWEPVSLQDMQKLGSPDLWVKDKAVWSGVVMKSCMYPLSHTEAMASISGGRVVAFVREAAKDADLARLKGEVKVLERALWSAVGRIVKSGNDCAVRNGGRPVLIDEVVQERKQQARKELEEEAQ